MNTRVLPAVPDKGTAKRVQPEILFLKFVGLFLCRCVPYILEVIHKNIYNKGHLC